MDTQTLPSGSLVLFPPAGLQAASPSGSVVGWWRTGELSWPHRAKGKLCSWGKIQAVSGACCVDGMLPLLGAVTHLASPGVGRVLPSLFHLLRAVETTSLLSQGSPQASAGRSGDPWACQGCKSTQAVGTEDLDRTVGNFSPTWFPGQETGVFHMSQELVFLSVFQSERT